MTTAFFACCRATAGLLNRRSSRTGMLNSCASSALSGTVMTASLDSTRLNGRNRIIAATLDRVWMFAMELLFITSSQTEMPMV